MSERIFILERRTTKPCAERLSSPKGGYRLKRAMLAILKNYSLTHRQRELPEVPLYHPKIVTNRMLVGFAQIEDRGWKLLLVR